MILILGGTTEGRSAVKVLDEGGAPYFYSTRSDMQRIVCRHGTHISGALNRDSMSDLCMEKRIRAIVDAAHPFATLLHATVADVGRSLGIPVIRYERRYPDAVEGIVWCDDFVDAVGKLREHGVRRLLSLTGVQTIGKLREYWIDNDCWFRILNRQESLSMAHGEGISDDRLLFYEDNNLEKIIDRVNPDAIITKESGESGGFMQKLDISRRQGIAFFVVRRPRMPEGFLTVEGEFGLRKEIERVVPGFFPLNIGFTTGSCATAASKAAIIALLTGERRERISFRIPDGEIMEMAVESVDISGESATACVVKDAGDDPDVTDKSRIVVRVSFARHDGIRFIGGEGVGTVSLPGLGLEVGEPAINPVPRMMMKSELEALTDRGLDVKISVPGGEELARKTFNPRVGVTGGISIIGTTGIVSPFSNEAFVESIKREMEVAIAVGCERIVVNSGGKSEKFVRTVYANLPPQAFIHYGNAIGDTLELAASLGVRNLTVGLMIGKAVKLAEGNLDTHSHKVTMNKGFLKEQAIEAGCSAAVVAVIDNITLARELWILPDADDADRFFNRILRLCYDVCRKVFRFGELELLLIADDGRIPYRIPRPVRYRSSFS